MLPEQFVEEANVVPFPYSSSGDSPSPDPMPSREETMQDVQNLIALRPPTDPATGEMVYNTPQAAQYRRALQGIVDRYDTMKDFQEAARLPDPAAVSGPQLASVDSPGPPNFTAAPSAEASLAQFAQSMMAPGPQGVPGGAVPGMLAPMQPGGPLPAAPAAAQLPARMPRRGTGMVL